MALGIGAYDEAFVWKSKTDFTGIRAVITLPSVYSVPANDPDGSYSYFNFYVGFGDSYVEAGVSFSRKTNKDGSWRKFCNPGAGSGTFVGTETGVAPGAPYGMLLTLDASGKADFVFNGNGVGSAWLNVTQAPVKVCVAIGDFTNQGHRVSFGKMSFSSIEVRQPDRKTWVGWLSDPKGLGFEHLCPTANGRTPALSKRAVADGVGAETL